MSKRTNKKTAAVILLLYIVSCAGLTGCSKTASENTSGNESATATTPYVSEETSDASSAPETPSDVSSETGTPDTTDLSSESSSGASSSLNSYTAASKAGSENYLQLASMFGSMNSETTAVTDLKLPEASDIFSVELAKDALTLCTGHTKSTQALLLQESGFEVLLQMNYDKASSDISHTSAYTVARKKIEYKGEERTLIYIAIRGTNSGEWFSNFNFAPLRSDDLRFTECFLYSAESIAFSLLPILNENPDSLILVSGHSRGAACANLLGMTLDDLYNPENIFVYTYATPYTLHDETLAGKYLNIFNIINPVDVVTNLPPASWGFSRLGTDIILPADPESIVTLNTALESVSVTANGIEEYYNKRYPISSDTGSKEYSTYEIMLSMASSISGVKVPDNDNMSLIELYQTEGVDNSAFGPLIANFKKLIGEDGSFGVEIFMRHMPATYMALLDYF